MPYMQRLTWGGIALHAGNLPGYSASHGCMRLPAEFARKLYAITHVGMTVFIIDQPASPRIAPTALNVFGTDALSKAETQVQWQPERSTRGPLSILVSARDNMAIVLRNGVVIGSSKITVAEPVLGTYAYVLQAGKPDELRWLRIDFGGDETGSLIKPQEWTRFTVPSDFTSKIRTILEMWLCFPLPPQRRA